ncbi:MAG: ATP-binding protein, partial [Desulfovibrio sp.]
MQSVPRPLLKEMDGAIATIKRQSRRVRELTGTLLVLGRGLDKESRAVNLAEVTEEVFGMFRTRLEDCGVEALMRIDPAMPAFLGSRLEMRQVLLHLVENAIDAMPDGGKLTVEGRVRTVEGGSEETLFGDGTDGSTGKVVEIRVRDTGEVIPEAVRGDIFQPFFTTREVGKGKGLGLAVCRSLVETRQGRIELEKSLPGNTCFRILLPFEKVPA